MNTKRYWLRGGIKAVLLYAVLFLVGFTNLILYVITFLPAVSFVPFISHCALNGFNGVDKTCPPEWIVRFSAGGQ